MDTRTRSYELTYIVSGALTDNEVAQVKTQIEQLLKKNSANILKTEDWGRRPLAYTIVSAGKKQKEGVYTHVVFELDAAQAPLFERELYLSNLAMRHLMVLAEETSEDASQSASS